MTANELAEESACFGCIEEGRQNAAQTWLLDQILQTGGGGGGGVTRVFRGSFGDPNGNVTASGAAIYYDTDGSEWIHQSAGTNDTNWSELIAA